MCSSEYFLFLLVCSGILCHWPSVLWHHALPDLWHLPARGHGGRGRRAEVLPVSHPVGPRSLDASLDGGDGTDGLGLHVVTE
jgi:hypothetical protein